MGLAVGAFDLRVKGKKKTTAEVDNQTTSGVVSSQSRIKSNYLTPHIGWLSVYDSGFCFGFELGYHIPFKSSSTYEAKAEESSLDAVLKTSSEFQDQKKDLEGIVKKLVQENRIMVKESHGAGLVLLERSERAFQAMHAFEPNLHRRVSYFNNDEDAFSDGQKAGSQFSGGRSALGSKNRRLEKGA